MRKAYEKPELEVISLKIEETLMDVDIGENLGSTEQGGGILPDDF